MDTGELVLHALFHNGQATWLADQAAAKGGQHENPFGVFLLVHWVLLRECPAVVKPIVSSRSGSCSGSQLPFPVDGQDPCRFSLDRAEIGGFQWEA